MLVGPVEHGLDSRVESLIPGLGPPVHWRALHFGGR
jgi:hypothetical protein